MDFDPVNRDVPAPRYELESGSEDEFEHQLDPKEGTAEVQDSFNIVPCDGSAEPKTLGHCNTLVILVGHAGAAFLSSMRGTVPMQQFSLRTHAEQHAAIAVIESGRGNKTAAALVAPPPQLRSWRFHEMAQTLIEATRPSNIVILDSYSPQEQLYRDPYSDDAEEPVDTAIRYLATPRYLATHPIDSRRLAPLRSPEAATGLGAAFLSKVRCFSCAFKGSRLFTNGCIDMDRTGLQQAVMDHVPAILALLEDVTFQSHIQLYGSLGAARLSPSTRATLSSLTGLDGKSAPLQAEAAPSILDFVASRRTKPAANLAVLGDGNMYI